MSIEVRAPDRVRVASQHGLGDWHDGEWMVARGCTKVSPGCVNCTAAWSLIDTPVAKATDRGADWTGVVEPIERQITVTPTRWDRPLRLFVGASTDFWHEGLSDEFRARVWAQVHRYKQHTFAFLTKRSREMCNWFERVDPEVPDNVWLGVSVENDDYRWRLDDLLMIDARVRFAQCEPLLDRVHLEPYLKPYPNGQRGLDWVAAGPEWGVANARPCDVRWMRQLRDDCAKHGIPFFTKHLLDGREHRELPT